MGPKVSGAIEVGQVQGAPQDHVGIRVDEAKEEDGVAKVTTMLGVKGHEDQEIFLHQNC